MVIVIIESILSDYLIPGTTLNRYMPRGIFNAIFFVDLLLRLFIGNNLIFEQFSEFIESHLGKIGMTSVNFFLNYTVFLL